MNQEPEPFDTPHGHIFFIAAMVGLLGQLLFLVVLNLDRSGERRVYWLSSAAVTGCVAVACLPHWKLAAVTAPCLFGMFVLGAFFKTPYLKIRGRIYAADSGDRRPDSLVDELRSASTGGTSNAVRIRWVLGVLAVVFVLAVAFWHPHPASRFAAAELPVTAGIGAGVGIAVTHAKRSEVMSCTAGFLVRTRTGQSGLLTAGHCNEPGGPGVVTINYIHDPPYRPIGTVDRAVAEGNGGRDFAMIRLDDTAQIPLITTVAGRPIVGVTSDVHTDDKVCHLGLFSRREKCGGVVVRAHGKLLYDAPSGCGDSGGPVYLVRDAVAVAIGIHIGGVQRDGSKPSCDVPHQRAVAELIQPWLEQWELTIATTPR